MESVTAGEIDLPFGILIDSAESHPFTFEAIVSDANHGGKTWRVRKRWCNLGRYPVSLGDYSIEGLVGRVAIERKSMEDAWGTVLGWESQYEREKDAAGRRERFESELANLNAIDSAAVIVEASFGACCLYMPEWGRKSRETNIKIFHRSVISWMQRFPRVPWLFCDSRRFAEITAFRWLDRFWREHAKEETQ